MFLLFTLRDCVSYLGFVFFFARSDVDDAVGWLFSDTWKGSCVPKKVQAKWDKVPHCSFVKILSLRSFSLCL